MKQARILLGLGLLVSATFVGACNTFIGADDPDVIEEGELSPGKETDDQDTEGGTGGGTGTADAPATCGDGIVNMFQNADDELVAEECDDQNDDPNDGCDACEVTCGENNVEGGDKNESESKDHHCYQFVQVEPLSYASAQGACRSWRKNAHLVVIDDEAEFIELQQGVQRFPEGQAAAWLGAKRNQGGTFEWMIGEALDGTVAPDDPHWADDQPRAPVEEEELCLSIGGESANDEGHFAAANCDDVYFYVCELEPPGTLPTPPGDSG